MRFALAAALIAASATSHADTYIFDANVISASNSSCFFPQQCLLTATIEVSSNGDGMFGSGSVTSAYFIVDQNGASLIPPGTGSFPEGSSFSGNPLSFSAFYAIPGSGQFPGEAWDAFLNWGNGGSW